MVRAIFQLFKERDVSYTEMGRLFSTHANLKYRLGPTSNGFSTNSSRAAHSGGNLHYASVQVHRAGNVRRSNFASTAKTWWTPKSSPTTTAHRGRDGPRHRPPGNQGRSWIGSCFGRFRRSGSGRRCGSPSPNRRLEPGRVHVGRRRTGLPERWQADVRSTTIRARATCTPARAKQGRCGYWSVKEEEVLPWLLTAIDREVWRQREDKPAVPKSIPATARRTASPSWSGRSPCCGARLMPPTTPTWWTT